MSSQIISPARSLSGTLHVPGDKSISHRQLMVAAVGDGDCLMAGLSDSLDVRATENALLRLGAIIRHPHPQVETQKLSTRGFDREILVEGRGFSGLRKPDSSIDCQNSGTTVRTLMGILAGRPWEISLDGDLSLKRRPMLRVIEPLRLMGAEISGTGPDDLLPLKIKGGELVGIEHRSPVASAQIKTSLMFAGLQASGRTSIEEPAPSRDHTERLLEYLDVQIERAPNRVIVKSTNIQNATSLSVPGDLSSAAFLLVAAAILPGSEVTVEDVGLNPTRTGILDVLRRFGASVTEAGVEDICGEPRGTVTVRAADRRPVTISGDEVVRTIDELPLVAVLGAFAEGETVIADAAELRVKESDRIATTAAGLASLGAEVTPTPEGLIVRGSARLKGASVDAAGDHRIAMALAVAALAADGPTEVGGWENVAVSFPGYLGALETLIER